jgi:hypothetical protein
MLEETPENVSAVILRNDDMWDFSLLMLGPSVPLQMVSNLRNFRDTQVKKKVNNIF